MYSVYSCTVHFHTYSEKDQVLTARGIQRLCAVSYCGEATNLTHQRTILITFVKLRYTTYCTLDHA